MDSALLGLILDSSAVIAAERRRQPIADFVREIRSKHGRIHLLLSPITAVELIHGIYRAPSPERAAMRSEYVTGLLRLIPSHPVTEATVWVAGRIQGEEAAKGNVLPFADLMIGAAAIELGFGVLTLNMRHFERIPGLRVVLAD